MIAEYCYYSFVVFLYERVKIYFFDTNWIVKMRYNIHDPNETICTSHQRVWMCIGSSKIFLYHLFQENWILRFWIANPTTTTPDISSQSPSPTSFNTVNLTRPVISILSSRHGTVEMLTFYPNFVKSTQIWILKSKPWTTCLKDQ